MILIASVQATTHRRLHRLQSDYLSGMPTNKVCPRCHQVGEFTKNNARVDGLSYLCRKCRSEERRIKRPSKYKGIIVDENGVRRCNQCGSPGPFPFNNHSRDGLHYVCYDCQRKSDRERYAANPEPKLARGKRWRAENKETVLASHRAWLDRNPGYTEAYNKRYLKEHPEKFRESAHRRRARKMAAEGSFTEAQFSKLKKLYDNRCLCCGRQEPEIQLQADHVVPLARGGSNDISNIQPLCRSCNSSKRANTVDYRPSDRQPLISVAST